jgi:hypothetical protein
MCKSEQTLKCLSSHSGRMKIRELTPKQLSSIPCPTCGVAVGRRCVLASGGKRSSPHVDRRLCAADAMRQKKLKGPQFEPFAQTAAALA